ncbi:uncharacterized protein LOC126662008 [Mercurialis annua]|uniref:uncharacterized protein LOC126662008 n=1 Tax=Mercurialis annua TaxID=3986 RepID=UPI00215EADA9|nr:uncharacterized protein LOC126662008 [Mercurialis annua]
MAAPSLYASSSSSSSSSNPFLTPIVTEEQFKIFHNIDRVLYKRLVLNLDRDSTQSMQVLGFWIWLERSGHVSNFVKKMLSLPDTLINSMADEAVICLNCIESDENFYYNYATSNDIIPLIHCVTKTGVSLQFFHENRLNILRAVSKIVSQVCLRAFEDILKQAEKLKSMVGGKQEMTKMPFGYYGHSVTNNSSSNNPAVLPMSYEYNTIHHQLGNSQFKASGGGGYSGNLLHGFDSYNNDLGVQRQVMDIGDLLRNIQINNSSEEETDFMNVPMDDRTIFLTFSKGYPISEDEVKDFFTRKYGDCIEAIHMQEVTVEDHQPLYARLIVRSSTLVHVFLEGQNKAKFSINGKHVWARKYIKKNPRMSSSLSPPQPSSPSWPTSSAAP